MCLVTDNMKLVYHVANKIIPPKGFDQQDIIQQGFIGLIRAARKFDKSKGVEFSTFATICIKSEIHKLLRRVNLRVDEVNYKAISLDSPLSENESDEFVLGDTVTSGESVEDDVVARDLIDWLRQIEPVIVDGLMKGQTQQEIGKRLGISQVQVSRRISRLKQALEKEMVG
ncbi:hypothetical protein BSNK01_12360 [Bacillaceae bacterium]